MTAIEFAFLENSIEGIRVAHANGFRSAPLLTKREAMDIGNDLLTDGLIDKHWLEKLAEKVKREPGLHGPMPGELQPEPRHHHIYPSGDPHRVARTT